MHLVLDGILEVDELILLDQHGINPAKPDQAVDFLQNIQALLVVQIHSRSNRVREHARLLDITHQADKIGGGCAAQVLPGFNRFEDAAMQRQGGLGLAGLFFYHFRCSKDDIIRVQPKVQKLHAPASLEKKNDVVRVREDGIADRTFQCNRVEALGCVEVLIFSERHDDGLIIFRGFANDIQDWGIFADVYGSHRFRQNHAFIAEDHFSFELTLLVGFAVPDEIERVQST